MNPQSKPETGPRLSSRAGAYRASAIRGLEAAARSRRGVRFLRLNIGQPDLTPPRSVQAALECKASSFGYGPSLGLPACRAAVAEHRHDACPALGPAHVAVTHGASEALLIALAVLCDPGDEVIVPEPFYANYRTLAAWVGVSLVAVPRTELDGFALPDTSVLERVCSPRTRAVLFSNPCNPTGSVQDDARLERLLWWSRRRGLMVIADEVYRHIWFDQPPSTLVSFQRYADTVVVVDSLSKSWSAPGLRVGFLISRNAGFMEAVDKLCQARLGAQPWAQAAAGAALELPSDYYGRLRSNWGRRVDTLVSSLQALPGVRCRAPSGAFYVMADLPVSDTTAFCSFMANTFEHEGESLLAAPGSGFFANPDRGRLLVRLAAVLSPRHLCRAVDLLGHGLVAWHRSHPPLVAVVGT